MKKPAPAKTWKVGVHIVYSDYILSQIVLLCFYKTLMLLHNFQVNESLFPCTLSKDNSRLAEEAVQLASKTWGQRSLTELEAEDRLSYSCEKVKSVKIPLFSLLKYYLTAHRA